MKSVVVCVTSSLVFALGMNSRAEAATFDFPNVTPDPNPQLTEGPAGDQFTFLKTAATTNGRYTLAEALIPPGAGPIPHIHHREDEWFYFPDGGLQLQMGDNVYPDTNYKNIPDGENLPKEHLHVTNTNPGDLFYGPKNHVHGFYNPGTKPERIVFVWTPGGIENYFQAVGQPITDPSKPPLITPENKALFVSLAPEYGITQSSTFWQYVDTVDNNFPDMGNHADELLTLLSPDIESVPESSSPLGMLAFGAFVAISILKRKHKSVSKVCLVLTNFVVNRFCGSSPIHGSSNE